MPPFPFGEFKRRGDRTDDRYRQGPTSNEAYFGILPRMKFAPVRRVSDPGR
jgi:hypothetical protein